jgi:ABC-type siderophore export system fused ATPase/permease subunit
MDGVPVGDHNRDRYRQAFSAIFADFHLFDRLLESGRDDVDDVGNRWLERLHLHCRPSCATVARRSLSSRTTTATSP